MTNELRDKLGQYAPDPPEGLWDNIAQSIPADPFHHVSSRLAHFEAAPPLESWDKINEALEFPKATFRPFTIFKRKGQASVFSSAALLIITATIAYTIYLTHQNSLSQKPATPGYTQQSILPDLLPKLPVSTAPGSPVPLNRRLSKTTGRFSKPLRAKRLFLNVIPIHHIPHSVPSIPFQADKKAEIHYLPIDAERVDGMMVYTDSNGRSFLVPKKLFDLVHCAQEHLDCKKHLETLRQKMADLTVGTDFTGILEMVNQLQENQ